MCRVALPTNAPCAAGAETLKNWTQKMILPPSFSLVTPTPSWKKSSPIPLDKLEHLCYTDPNLHISTFPDNDQLGACRIFFRQGFRNLNI